MGTLVDLRPRPSLTDVLLSHPLLATCAHGFIATGLMSELGDGDSITLFLPRREALLHLPWKIEQLLLDESLVEERFDLFEYTIVSGLLDAQADQEATSLQGERVRVRGGKVFGRFGSASIIESIRARNGIAHILDSCLLPVDPAAYAAASA
jgi:uncharacterized surface protein with fasciclin (FAS1) repeats